MLPKPASLFAVSFLAATLAFSQSFTASLTGSVKDQSGATIPGALVSAVNVDTNASQTFTTDGTGLYRFPALAPGSYR
ncbi:MAG: carboxypeptidase-like regulatory domain-containing protein, partial [Acidobacteria bacterium]|nr:carboxypeptidase-like regulatory domain-containing protein [Acidobacteriota bacterium]